MLRRGGKTRLPETATPPFHAQHNAALLLPVPLLLSIIGAASPLYLASALALGAAFAWRMRRLRFDEAPGAAMAVFRFSIY